MDVDLHQRVRQERADVDARADRKVQDRHGREGVRLTDDAIARDAEHRRGSNAHDQKAEQASSAQVTAAQRDKRRERDRQRDACGQPIGKRNGRGRTDCHATTGGGESDRDVLHHLRPGGGRGRGQQERADNDAQHVLPEEMLDCDHVQYPCVGRNGVRAAASAAFDCMFAGVCREYNDFVRIGDSGCG